MSAPPRGTPARAVRRQSTQGADADADVELSETTPVVAAPDGGYGWVVVAASFCSNFLIEGCNTSFATYIPSIMEAFDEHESAVSLVGSLLVGINQLSGPLASGIANRYGFRAALISGGLLASVGVALSFFSTSVGFLYVTFGLLGGVGGGLVYVTFGLLGGVGGGLVYVPAVIAVNFFFSRWRALAVSIAMVGSNLGGATLPHLVGFNVDHLGWRYALLVQAGLLLCCSALGVFFRPPPSTPVTPATQGIATPLSITSATVGRRRGSRAHYPSVMEVVGSNHAVQPTLTRRPSQLGPGQGTAPTQRESLVQAAKEAAQGGRCARCLRTTFCCAACRRRRKAKGVRPLYRDDIFYEGSTVRLAQFDSTPGAGAQAYDLRVTRVASRRDVTEEMSARCVVWPRAVRRTLRTMCDVTLLRTLPMALVTAAFMCSSAAYYVPFTFLRARELAKGGDETRATMFLTAISLSAMAGRLVCAGVTSLLCTNHFYVICAVQTLGACAVLACAFDPPYEAQLACCVCYGFALACTSNLRSIIIVDLVGLQNLTNAFGLVMLFQGVGFIAGPPIASLIKEATGGFSSVFWFAGLLILTSAMLLCPLNALRKRRPPGDLR